MISARLKLAIKMKASAPSSAGRAPLAVSLRTSVSSPMAAKATDSRKVVTAAIQILSAAGTVTRLLSPTSATKPSTNQGIGGRADDATATGSFFVARHAAIDPSIITVGASSMTRDSFAMVANSPAFCPSWKEAAMTCAISWIDAPLQSPKACGSRCRSPGSSG